MNTKSSSVFERDLNPVADKLDARSAQAAVLSPRPLLTASLLLVSDVIVLALAALLASGVWSQFNMLVQPDVYYRLWPLLSVFPLTYFMLGLYPGAGVNPVDELKRLSYLTTAVYLLVVLVLFLSKDVVIASRGIYLLSWLLSLLLVPLGRATLRHLFASRPWWGVPVVVLGGGKTGQLIMRRLRGNPGLGLKVLGCFDDDEEKQLACRRTGISGCLADAAPAAREYGVRHALVAMPGLRPSDLSRLTRQYANVFPHLIVVPDMFGMASLGVDTMDFAGVVGLHARQNLLLRHNRVSKRVIDLLMLLPAALVAVPIVLVAMLWIVLVSRGTPFYAQRREGYQGRAINVWKLRTMHFNADELLERHLDKHPEARQEWEQFYKLKRDPRILPGAGLLRKLSIDELPQLFNILKGEMSFVGPRPFPYYHLESFNDEFRALRVEAQPGITGLWQVSARSDGDLEVQEELDSYYIRNWSPWLDVYILARTPWSVLFSKGAY